MSILLSAYYPEGIVFVADKNITFTVNTETGTRKFVESTGTKVLSWPNNKAIIGYVGLGQLAGLPMEEWLRIFIAGSRDFESLEKLASQLIDLIQKDYSDDYQSTEVDDKRLIIHLGGYSKKEETVVPVLYSIKNYSGKIDPRTGEYPPGERVFYLIEEIETNFRGWPNPEDYPERVRDRLQNMVDQGRYLWFNNGYNLGAFNVFKDVVWGALKIIRDNGFAPNIIGIMARVAFCQMAVDIFGSYFTHHNFPEDRAVGGGADAVYIPWPE